MTHETTRSLDWTRLHSGALSKEKIKEVTKSDDWQAFRKTLKGTSMEAKYDALEGWLEVNDHGDDAKCQVTNYINAMARSGQIKKAVVK